MRIEKDERARLIEIDILGQPVKPSGVIVFDVNGQNARPRGCGAGGNEQRRHP